MTIIHEILVGRTRLRIERDPATGEHLYFIDDCLKDVNAYIAVIEAFRRRAAGMRPPDKGTE